MADPKETKKAPEAPKEEPKVDSSELDYKDGKPVGEVGTHVLQNGFVVTTF